MRERESKRLRRFVKYLFSFIIALSLSFTVHSSVYAATYYVRADGTVTAANKANATSPANANTSLSMAQVNAATFVAGDQVLFSSQGGNYSAELIIPSGGSGVGNEITYGNVSNETPIIAITSGYLLDTNSKSNVIIQGITFNCTGNSATTNIGTIIKAGSNIQFKNYSSNMGGYGYVVWSNAILSNITFDGVSLISGTPSRAAINLTGSSNSNITIQNSTFNPGVTINNGSTVLLTESTLVGAFVITTGSNVTASNISSIGGISYTSVDTGTISNVIETSVSRFIFTNSSNLTINDSSVTGSTGYGAMEVNGTSHDITFNRCTASNNSNNGFVQEDSSNNITCNNCVADNNNNIGFLARQTASNITYRYSEASYNGTVNVVFDGAGFLPHDSATNVKCYYCIAHHNFTTGIGDVSTGTNSFYNNISWANGYAIGDTFRGSQVTTASTRGNTYFSSGKSAGSTTIKNTIMGMGKPREITSTANSAYTILDYNLYNPIDSNKFISYDAVNETTWTTYHQSNETHSQNADPAFVNTSTPDFHLQSSSPAINAGANVSLTSDYSGTPVPQGSAPDIGAYEFLLPSSPSSLSQYKSDGTTVISSGVFTGESTVTLKFSMSSSNSLDSLTPQVEVRENGTSFSNTVTSSGNAVAYSGSPVTGTVTVTGLTTGKSYHWQARTSNPAGQSGWTAKGGSPDFQVDITTPKTTDNVDSSWHNSNVTITLTCSDGIGSGCANTYYTTDGSTPTTSSSQGTSIILKASGTYTIKYFSVDSVGNKESVETSSNTVKISKTDPTRAILSSPTGYTKDNTRPTLVFKKSTAGSGIATYTVSLDSGKNRSLSTSGIPSSGNGSSDYIWKEDSSVKVEFLNENDSDSSNDEIHVYFKDLDKQELSEGKHTWKVTAYDNAGNSTANSADIYIDKTSPAISDLAIANVSTVISGVSYNLNITDRMPSFSGLAYDNYQGSTDVSNTNGTKNSFDKISSGPQTLTLTFKKRKDDKTYSDYLTKDYSLSDIQDKNGDSKSIRFYITTPYTLTDGNYKVSLVLKDGTGNTYNQPDFYITINTSSANPVQQLFTNNLETKVTKQETVPATTQEEKKQVQENGYTVKIKVVDNKNKPVAGAKVTIHSKVQETTTDKSGIAQFSNVERGDHRVLIAYDGYKGEQAINLTGEVKEFSFNIQVKQQNAFFNPQVIGVIGVMIAAISVMGFLLIKAKRKEAR